MKTLATESASATFTGDRTTVNNEYQTLITDIDRQAANIGLNDGGSSVQSNSQVARDLSGIGNAVDSAPGRRKHQPAERRLRLETTSPISTLPTPDFWPA